MFRLSSICPKFHKRLFKSCLVTDNKDASCIYLQVNSIVSDLSTDNLFSGTQINAILKYFSAGHGFVNNMYWHVAHHGDTPLVAIISQHDWCWSTQSAVTVRGFEWPSSPKTRESVECKSSSANFFIFLETSLTQRPGCMHLSPMTRVCPGGRNWGPPRGFREQGNVTIYF